MARKRVEAGVPACSSHPDGWVVRYGAYGSGLHRRQRWRCDPPSGAPHTFTGGLVRTVMDRPSSCLSCEQKLATHQGPGLPSRYRYPVREVAVALQRVGAGMSYSEAAVRAQVQTKGGGHATAQLVGNWVEVFGPVVAERWKETTWPETVVLDSRTFHANQQGGGSGVVFTVMAVHGYESKKRHRLWAVQAVPGPPDGQKWAAFLSSLPGSPVMAVTDDDSTTIGGIRRAFPRTAIRLCRFHLGENLWDKLERALPNQANHPARIAAVGALDSLAQWEAFLDVVDQHQVSFFTPGKWRTHVSKLLTAEFAAEPLPDVRGNGAVEEDLRTIRDLIGRRAFCFRNAERTNRLLELARLEINRRDSVDQYSADIRTFLDAGGPPSRQLAIADQHGPSLRI